MNQPSHTSSASNHPCGTDGCTQTVRGVNMGKIGIYYPKFCTECSNQHQREYEAQRELVDHTARVKRLGLPPRFTAARFENFDKTKQENAFRIASGFAEQYSHKHTRGLYLFGHAGSGKTHLAAAIGNSLIDRKVNGVRFVTAPELLLAIRRSFTGGAGDELLDVLGQTELLIIDDLGSEKPTDWVQETLFVLIDRRYTAYRQTVFTSNYSLDELKDRLGYRTASRIAEMAELVELSPSDYRIYQATKHTK